MQTQTQTSSPSPKGQAMSANSISALSFDNAQFIAAFRGIARVWNSGAGDAEILAPAVDAFEAEALKRGMNLSEILKGC